MTEITLFAGYRNIYTSEYRIFLQLDAKHYVKKKWRLVMLDENNGLCPFRSNKKIYHE